MSLRSVRVRAFVGVAAASAALVVGGCADLVGSDFGHDGLTREAAASDADGVFDTLVSDVLESWCAFNPTTATQLGVHTWDDQLEDYSKAGLERQSRELHEFVRRLTAVDVRPLSASRRIDRDFLVHALDSQLLPLDVTKIFEKNPDLYSSGIANTANVMIRRSFASPERRMQLLTLRERRMPDALMAARTNLVNPPRIYTEIALAQVEGNRDLFKNDVPKAFGAVKDVALLTDFERANADVVAALDAYKEWMQTELLPRSNGDFALGAAVYRRKLWIDEMVDAPLDELLKIATADLKRNQQAFAETAAKIDATKTPSEVLAALQLEHVPADQLLAKTQSELDSIASFITDHRILTIPGAVQAKVQETPPYLRAVTFASMDTPGAFEKVATEAYYSMTLPDPASSAADQEEFMKQWYPAAITNVSVHEAWPGHYLQALVAKGYPSDARRVFGCNTNIEGWAHYCEQMMQDEGFHADDPRFRLAQLQDALLRNVRFVVGIRMHTQGMSMAEAETMFEKEGYQPAPVAQGEAKRATTDPTFGYYTMGKLAILKLREDWKKKTGADYSLQKFHDTFLALGPLPLPLIRKAMLGEEGRMF
jgi:uncharacterized protein (DUF885 family)